jgi:Glycosyltransferase family 87
MRGRTWIAVAAFVAVAGIVAHRATTRLMVRPPQMPEQWTMCDFQGTLYYPAVAFLAGSNPYDPAFADDYPVERRLPAYGPLTLLLHLPLGLLPLPIAETAYFLLTLALILVVAALTLRTCGLPSTSTWIFGLGTLMILSRPGHKNLLLGQSTMEVVLGIYLALIYTRDRPLVAALGLALTTMKPQFALPLVPLLLAARAYRVVTVGLAISAVLSLATLLPYGTAGMLSWWRALAHSSAAAGQPSAMWFLRMDLGDALRVIFGAHSGLVDLAVAASTLALAAFIIRRARLGDRPIAASALALTATCSAVLVSTYHLTYDAILLTLPVVALFAGLDADDVPPVTRLALAALLLLPAVHYDLPTGRVVDTLGLGPQWRIGFAVANGVALSAALVLSAFAVGQRRSDPRLRGA